MNFPSRHPLNQSRARRAADRKRGRDPGAGTHRLLGHGQHSSRDQLDRSYEPITKPGAKLISITRGDLFIKSNYQDFQRYPEVDLAIAADAEATLPSLIEAVQAHDQRRSQERVRGARQKARGRAPASAASAARDEAAYGWDASPISTARLSAELWAQIKDEDWSLVSEVAPAATGRSGCGISTSITSSSAARAARASATARPAAVGAALANKKHGRLSRQHSERRRSDVCAGRSVDGGASPDSAAQRDAQQSRVSSGSDAHAAHGQPAQARHRTRDDRHHASPIRNIDFAKLAQGMGVYAEGPITDPKDLGPAIQRAVAVVKRGEPALVDVSSQPR